MADGKRKTTAYSRALKARSAHCKSGTLVTKSRLDRAVKAYKEHASKSGKPSAAISKVVAKLTKSCSATKKTTKKKS